MTLSASLSSAEASSLGCRHESGRTTFGLWAPHATAVSVVTTGSGDTTTTACDPGDGGTWHAVADAQPGDQYHYVITSADGTQLERSDPRARAMTNSVGRSVVVDDEYDWRVEEFVMAPLNELVIYELHPRTFAGTLDEVAERLDSVAELGFNVIEIMPVAEFSGDISWGYNPAQPFAVESSYGGPAAMKRLVDRAHELGLAVVVDVVYNHFGPSDLDLWRFDGWYENDGGGIYFYNDWQAETAWGATRPDYGREEVRQYLIDNALMWLTEYRVDGLRLDSTVNIRNGHGEPGPYGDIEDGARFLRDLSDTVHAHFSGRLLIAEDLQQDPAITRPTAEGGYGFDLQWSAGFVHRVRDALENGAGPSAVIGALQAGQPFKRVVFTESHDEVANGRTRVNASVNPENPDAWDAFRLAAIGATLTLTAADVPMVFQGQEWGDDRWFDDEHHYDWEARAHNTGHLALWRDLIGLRTGSDDRAPGLRGDQLRILDTGNDDTGNDGIVAFLRWGIGGEAAAALVIVNLGDNETTSELHDVDGEWSCVFDSSSVHYHHTGSEQPTRVSLGDVTTVTMPAFGAAIFTRP